MIVTLEEIKAHLRIEHDEEDELLETLIAQVSDDICNYCRRDFAGPEVNEYSVPGAVKLATKLMVSHYYENRDIQDHLNYRAAMHAYESLLYPYRDPSKMF